MGFISFGKRTKHQKFEFNPRYYDPIKDELKDRLRMASDDTSPEITKMRIRDGLRRKSRGNKQLESSLRKSSNIRLLVIVGVLIAGTYMLMTSEGILQFIEKMSGY